MVELNVTLNTFPSLFFGVGAGGGVSGPLLSYDAGAPNIGGQTGVLRYTLTPGQFTQPLAVFTFRYPDGGGEVLCDATVTFYDLVEDPE